MMTNTISNQHKKDETLYEIVIGTWCTLTYVIMLVYVYACTYTLLGSIYD